MSRQERTRLLREEAFCLAYAGEARGSGNRAAIIAGYPVPSAGNNASLLLRRADIQKRIRELLDELCSRLDLSAERVLLEYRTIAFSNVLDYTRQGPDGSRLIDLDSMTRVQAAAISELTVEDYEENDPDAPEYVEDEHTGQRVKNKKTRTVRRTKIKWHPKLPALEALSKHLAIPGIGTTKLEITNPDGTLAGQPVINVQFVEALEGRPVPELPDGSTIEGEAVEPSTLEPPTGDDEDEEQPLDESESDDDAW